MLKDFRETLYAELRSEEAKIHFIEAYFEQDGIIGIQRALRVIAEADRYAKTGILPVEKHRSTRRTVRRTKIKRSPNDAFLLRNRLRAHGLDLTVTPRQK